jgi:hypothetical protein
MLRLDVLWVVARVGDNHEPGSAMGVLASQTRANVEHGIVSVCRCQVVKLCEARQGNARSYLVIMVEESKLLFREVSELCRHASVLTPG